MEPQKVEMSFHYHPLTPVKMESKCDWCGLKFKGIYDGYKCEECNFGLIHKSCANKANNLPHPSQKCRNTLQLTFNFKVGDTVRCARCGGEIHDDYYYMCNKCVLVPREGDGFGSSSFHFSCAKYPPPEVIDVPQHHNHKLKLEMVVSCFTCAACGADGDGYPYKCEECDLTFHPSCEKYGAEVNHILHSLHPLKLFYGEPPAYTNGTCRLCEGKLAEFEVFYHCSRCNFSLDLHCAFHPPPLYVHDLDIHEHNLTLMPKSISFTCTTCGLNGERNPYVCLPCDFTAHNDCSGFPWVININRHDHRVFRTSNIGVVNAVCGVCQRKMDWSCGGYSCKRCTEFVYHTKCATREDVSDGIEMKDEPEEEEAMEPFKIIDENTIQHFSHEKFRHQMHYLRLDKSGIFIEGRRCEACAYPIYHHSLYSCLDCDFKLHESCANLPTRKRHMVSNKRYTCEVIGESVDSPKCTACGVIFNGFTYDGDSHENVLDVRCASVTEPFVHQSHPHPVFYTSPQGVCSACDQHAHHVLRCVEDKCGYILDFKCALLPYEVKHRVDDHFLSLCYGEDGEKTSGKYWCNICEKETDPKSWFYTSKDCELTLHTNCVLGDLRALVPRREVATYHDGVERYYEVVPNDSMSRPLCSKCKSRCMFHVFLQVSNGRYNWSDQYSLRDEYYCSIFCRRLTYGD